MKSVLVLLPIAATVVAKSQLEISAEDPVFGVNTVHGCYSSLGELKLNGTNEFNSQGQCSSSCEAAGAYVAASQGEKCYCGDKYPAANTLVDDSECTEPCPGYSAEACGGTKTFTVYNTGLKVDVDESSGDDSSSSKVSTGTSSGTASASVVTVSPTTTVVAATGTSSNNTSSTTGVSSGLTSGTASASSTPTAVSANGAVSQFSLSVFSLAVLSLGTMFLL